MDSLNRKFSIVSILSVILILATISSMNASSSQDFKSSSAVVSNWIFNRKIVYPANHYITGLIANSDQTGLLASAYDVNGNLTEEVLSLSTDQGLSWKNLGHPCWSPIQISKDGLKIYCRRPGNEPVIIDSSHDGGVTWNSILVYGDNTDHLATEALFKDAALTSSLDGRKIYVAMSAHRLFDSSTPSFVMGGIFISSDSGMNWSQSQTDPNLGWSSITSSADGVDLVACTEAYLLTNPGFTKNEGTNATSSIYISRDAGITWNKRFTMPAIKNPHNDALPSKLVSSKDGKIIYALFNGSIYRSINAGDSWTNSSLSRAGLETITTSDSGKQVAASGRNAILYFSDDYGKSWVIPSGQENLYSKLMVGGLHPEGTTGWSQIILSADGRKIEGVMHSYNQSYNLYSIEMPASFIPSKTLHFASCATLRGSKYYYSFNSKPPYCNSGFYTSPTAMFPR